jgi:ABC-type uncharacterized transport system substrate-binding protein
MSFKLIITYILIFYNFSVFSKTFHVTVIHSYQERTWTIEGTKGVRKVLQQSNVNFQINQLIYDYTMIKNESEHIKKKNEIVKNILDNNSNVIIIFNDEATDALLSSLNELHIPIVVTGINKELSETKWFRKDGDPKRNFTGILERYPFEQSLKMLKKIRPSVKKIIILTSENETSRIVTEQILNRFKKYNGEYSGIKLLPKSLIKYVKVFKHGLSVQQYENAIVLIDDDKLVQINWSIFCEKRKFPIWCFKSIDEFLSVSKNFHRKTRIYIDSNLGEGIRGEIESEKIFLAGFSNLFLATGLEKDSIQRPLWIKDIYSKSPESIEYF